MRRWWLGIALAVVLVLTGSIAWSAEDAGRSGEDSGHAVSLVLFIVAAVLGVISIMRLLRDKPN